MVVGIVKVSLHIPETRSLKSKRQVVKKLIQRVNGRFKNLAVSEVADQDLWQKAVIGISAVGPDSRLVNSLLDKVLDYMEEFEDFEIIQADIDIINM
ncbi:DUF503 domain-containing protein [Thermodesulfatator atlanticus]|uniref:DUF503 domain-containing protein n=1 Tax=Thermodesulfatator atlanticus TaxID=501497 RepID=UPI0003B6A522|nr:DUF503 domain-containing protein [Thermodesulfatator atlanticus]